MPGSQDREVLTSDESLYAVLEVVPRSGAPLENDRVGPTRVVAVDLVPARRRGAPRFFAEGDFKCSGSRFSCGRLAEARGALLLGTPFPTSLETGALATWEEGTTRSLEGSRFDFLDLSGLPLMRLTSELDGRPARVEVRLVKKCRARAVRVNETRWEGTGSGVIAVPARVHHSWVELERPDCFAPEDLESVIPTPD
ncbi:hypothetical protein HMI49_19460 [Corallococcus exercitus]|uniref:Uncharacterized protein n=1 Tax=Corallococcus exercitus TaxID=2316736 RepID=A0A7Y4KLY1_9BACT|nr:hypothetical protein [Corallococcus exercitus]NOK35384.1 hypothetical protein [Corallococcus exercitus]